MAYITIHTLNKLSRRLDIKDEYYQEVSKESIFRHDKLFRLFNSLEMKQIYSYKTLIENTEYLNYFNAVPKTLDTRRYVFEKEDFSKYHLYKDCKFLLKDFKNYHIPPEIIELGDAIVDEYRTWFKLNDFQKMFENGQIDSNRVTERYNLLFPKKYNIAELNMNYHLIEIISNSGTNDITSDFQIVDFEKRLDEYLELDTYLLNSPTMVLLAKNDYMKNKEDWEINNFIEKVLNENFLRNYTIERLRIFWDSTSDLKHRIKMDVLLYFNWTFKLHEKVYDPISLEQFGLNCCRACEDKFNLQNFRDKLLT